MSQEVLRVVKLVPGTSVDGPGLRTSIYFAGCMHHCPECHNPQTWNPDAGRDMTIDEIVDFINEQDFNVTFSGGDPLLQIEGLLPLANRLKNEGRNIWCYTGYTIEEILKDDSLSRILNYIDVIVDGRFEIEKRDISLLFRGSSNQRLIDVNKSKFPEITLWSRMQL